MADYEADARQVQRVRAAVRALTRQLSEFGDVQVLVSYVDSLGNTAMIADGEGNWHARVGMALSFLERSKANDARDLPAAPPPRAQGDGTDAGPSWEDDIPDIDFDAGL